MASATIFALLVGGACGYHVPSLRSQHVRQPRSMRSRLIIAFRGDLYKHLLDE